MDCSPPGSFIHGISQARIPEWIAISSSRGSSHGSNLRFLRHLGSPRECATQRTRALVQYGQLLSSQVSVPAWGLGRGQGTLRPDRRLGAWPSPAGRRTRAASGCSAGAQEAGAHGGCCGVNGVHVHACTHLGTLIYTWAHS